MDSDYRIEPDKALTALKIMLNSSISRKEGTIDILLLLVLSYQLSYLYINMEQYPWSHLTQSYETLKSHHLKELLANQQRNSSLITKYEDLIFDYTHEKLNT